MRGNVPCPLLRDKEEDNSGKILYVLCGNIRMEWDFEFKWMASYVSPSLNLQVIFISSLSNYHYLIMENLLYSSVQPTLHKWATSYLPS